MRYETRERLRRMAQGGRFYATFDMQAARDKAQELKARITKAREDLAAMAMAEGYKAEDGRELYAQIERDVEQYNHIACVIEREDAAARARVAQKFNDKLAGVAARNREALGGLFRAMLTGMDAAPEIRAALSLPTVTGGEAGAGATLLPVTVSNELIRDIVEDDTLLSEITVTAIPGLEVPVVDTEDVDGDDVDDGVDAPEATTNAKRLIYGRFPYAKATGVPNSLLDGTDTALESYITTRHSEMMRARMLKRIFDAAATGNYTHMSVYHADNAIEKVTYTAEETLLDGIMAALAALPSRPSGVYKVALSMANWMSIIRELANGATALFGTPTREILGFEPVICNYATKPLVGDLKTIHLNYDSPISFETQRFARKRITDFVLSTYYDIHVEQPELLRIVEAAA